MIKTLLLALCLIQPSLALAGKGEKPQDLEKLIRMAELYLDWQYFPEARKSYQEILARDPGHHGVHEALGYIFLTEQKSAEAIACFNKELTIQPHSHLLKLLLGLAHFQGGDEALAHQLLQEISSNYYFLRGNPDVAKKYGGEPASYFKKYLFFKKFMNDNFGLIPYARGMLFTRQGRWKKALEMMTLAAEQKYCLAEVLVQLVDLHMQLQDGAAAAFELSRLTREDSQLAEQLDDLIQAGDNQKILQFALSRPTRIRYFISPVNVIVKQLNVMAQESVKRADPQSAFRTWKKALFADEKRFDIHYNLALIYCLYNFQKDALYHCRRAIDMGDKRYQPWALNLAGNIEFEMGRYQKALEYYRQAVELDAKYTKCRNNLGATYMKLGEAEHAEEEWRKVIRNTGRGEKENEVQEIDEQEKVKVWVDVKESDDIIEASKSLATLYITQKRQTEAIPLLNNVLQFIPADAEAHFLLGKVYLHLEKPSLARTHLHKAIKNGTSHEAEARKFCLQLDQLANKELPKSKKKNK